MNTQTVMSAPIVSRLKEAGELRIEDFTKDRVDFLSSQINECYEEGVGISSSKLSTIFYGYIQPMYKFEGIAFYAFGLVATRDASKKSGPLFFVHKEDVGKTIFPAIDSTYHNYSVLASLENSVNSSSSSDWSSAIWNSSSEEVSSSSVDSTEGSNSVIVDALSKVTSLLGEVCSALSATIKTLK